MATNLVSTLPAQPPTFTKDYINFLYPLMYLSFYPLNWDTLACIKTLFFQILILCVSEVEVANNIKMRCKLNDSGTHSFRIWCNSIGQMGQAKRLILFTFLRRAEKGNHWSAEYKSVGKKHKHFLSLPVLNLMKKGTCYYAILPKK